MRMKNANQVCKGSSKGVWRVSAMSEHGAPGTVRLRREGGHVAVSLFDPKADMRAFRHHNARRSAHYFRIKGTNTTGATVLVLAVPSAYFTNTMRC